MTERTRSDEDLALALAGATAFYRQGGTLTYTEWVCFSPEDQLLMSKAAEAVRIEALLKLRLALSSEEGMADVLSPLDGGRLLERLKLEAMAARLAVGGP